MAANPVGAVILSDGGAPRILTGYAREAVSGGWAVTTSGASATAVVGSDSTSFSTGSLLFAQASGLDFTGIALHNAGSNTPVSVIRRADIICVAAGTVVAGEVVACNGAQAYVPALAGSNHIGKALTAAGSEGYFVLDLGATG